MTQLNKQEKSKMCKIVIVDDVKEIRGGIKENLTSIFPEHIILAYASTQTALKKVKELDNVDIVLFNSLESKDPNGIEFAKVLRKNHPGIMLIYITHGEKPNYEHMTMLANFGIDNYLLLPYDKEAVEFVIKNSVNRINSLQSYKTNEHIELEEAVGNLLKNIKRLSSSGKISKIKK